MRFEKIQREVSFPVVGVHAPSRVGTLSAA